MSKEKTNGIRCFEILEELITISMKDKFVINEICIPKWLFIEMIDNKDKLPDEESKKFMYSNKHAMESILMWGIFISYHSLVNNIYVNYSEYGVKKYFIFKDMIEFCAGYANLNKIEYSDAIRIFIPDFNKEDI